MDRQEKKTAAVLLSAWNGEKYIQTQIESILAQDYGETELYIYDDCSSDRTPEILRTLEKEHARVHVTYGKKNLGYPACFYALTDREDIQADVVFFSDQDDRWYPDKISRAMAKLSRREKELREEQGKEAALAYFAGYDLCDGALNRIRTVIPARAGKEVRLQHTLYEVCGLEFTMAVNRKAFELLQKNRPRETGGRGTWMNLLYAALGEILVDDVPVAAYRRHEASVTNKGTSRRSLWKWRAGHFKKQELAEYRRMLQEFERTVGDRLTQEDARLLHRFSSGRYFPDALIKCFWPHRLRSGWSDEIALRGTFFLGWL